MLLRQLMENTKFENIHLDSHSGQNSAKIIAIIDGKKVGSLEYTEFNDEISIDMIQVDKEHRNKKIGFNLIKELSKLFAYTKIKRGNLTDDGAKLYKSTEKYFAPYIKKGVDEWGKNLLFKKYFEEDISYYSKSDFDDVLKTWNNEKIEIDNLDYYEDISNIENLLKQNKVKYKLSKTKLLITIDTNVSNCLELFKNNFPKVAPKLLNDYGDFMETLFGKLSD